MKTTLVGRDLLSIGDLTPEELTYVLDVAQTQKEAWALGDRDVPLAGRSVALIFQKPSLRTLVSFEVACARLGLHPVTMQGRDTAFSRGESPFDTTMVLERYVDAIAIRTFEQSLLTEVAAYAEIPVLNMLSDDHHPFQGLADLLTMREHHGSLSGLSFAYVGDGNNMANTYLLGGALAGMDVRIATPSGYEPPAEIVQHAEELAAEAGAKICICGGPEEAVKGAKVVATDTWASMGQEEEYEMRLEVFGAFTVDDDLMAQAAGDAIFMHCLPAHRGEEVSDEVIDSTCSVVFDEAENRLHVQKAWLSLVLGA
ncbi:MAG: ornithine carbamoyltransferase [Coriobacteriales bacterium]|nr:ornithine carbamoyltransferase [Coriobacteriales bacterium]